MSEPVGAVAQVRFFIGTNGNLYAFENQTAQTFLVGRPPSPVPLSSIIDDWHFDFPYVGGWTGDLRYRYLNNQKLLMFEGLLTPPTVPPPTNVLIQVGALVPPWVPSRIARFPILEETSDKKGNFIAGGGINFDVDGSVRVIVSAALCSNLAICGLIPLD